MDQLKRVLGLPMLLFYGVGVIVGAGIYTIIGAAAGEAGKAVWLSLALAAVPALLAGVCYAELATMFPRAGAAYVYVKEAAPKRPWASFMVGYLTAVTAAAVAATVAMAFAGYLALFLPIPAWLGAVALLGACTAVNIIGIRESTWVTIICTCIEVVGLVVISIAGARAESFGEGVFDISLAPVLSGAALCFFVYTGFEGLANLAEETKKPAKHLPLAILVSLGLTTIMYVVVAVAVVGLVEPEELASSDSPLSTAAEAASPALATAMGWIALFSTANTALITLVVASRLVYGMADSGQAPAALARTLPKRKSPWAAAILIGGAAAAMLPLGNVAIVGSVSSLTTLLIFAAVAGSLIAIRVRRPEVKASFRAPGNVGRVPVVAVLTILAAAGLMIQFEGMVYLVTGGALVLGAGLYGLRFLWRTDNGKDETR